MAAVLEIERKEKKDVPVTVKLTESASRFVSVRARQLGMESDSEYIRQLIADDQHRAADNRFNANERRQLLPLLMSLMKATGELIYAIQD